MTGSLIPLAFEGQSIRVQDDEGHPWFIAADVCAALGIQNVTQAIAKLEADERSMISIGRQGETNVLSEAGVYTVALRCRDAMKPDTPPYRFRKWVTGVALPALRRGHDVPVGLTAPDRGAIGGIVKGIVNKAMSEMLPMLVKEALSTSRYHLVEGVSALEIADIAGYPAGKRPRGASQYISRRLDRYHKDRGVAVNRSRHGSSRVCLFDEPTARTWLQAGGKVEIDHYIANRKGQGKLRLISPN